MVSTTAVNLTVDRVVPVTPQVVQLQESNFLHELWLNLAQGGLWEGRKGIFGGLPLYLENVCHPVQTRYSVPFESNIWTTNSAFILYFSRYL